MQSIDPDTDHLNEVFEPGFSNNVDTNFCSISDYNSLALNSENDLVLRHLNSCSYDAHIDDLHAIFKIGTTYPHVLSLSEAWLSEQSISHLIGFQGYHTLRTIRKSDGVSVYIKSCLDSRFLPEFSFAKEHIEVCTVKFSVDKAEAFIIGVYIPVNGRVHSFLYNSDEVFSQNCPS